MLRASNPIRRRGGHYVFDYLALVSKITHGVTVHKTDVFLTPKLRSQKPQFAGLSEGSFLRVFLTPVLEPCATVRFRNYKG